MQTPPAVDPQLHTRCGLAPLGALAVVMLLSGVTIAFELAIDHSTDRRAADLDSAVQGVVLVDDLRTQLDRWRASTAAQRAPIGARIQADVAALDPIATVIGAREEWSQLALVLHRLIGAEATTTRIVFDTAQRSLDRFAAGNERGAALHRAELADADRRRSLIRAVVGFAILGLSAAVALMVIRMARRERAHLVALAGRDHS